MRTVLFQSQQVEEQEQAALAAAGGVNEGEAGNCQSLPALGAVAEGVATTRATSNQKSPET